MVDEEPFSERTNIRLSVRWFIYLVSQSVTRSVRHSVSQSVVRWFIYLVSQSVTQSVRHSVSQSVVSQSVGRSVSQ